MKFLAVALLFLVFALAAVRAIDEDERCVVHSDDCASCLDAGCGWCSEGFCSAADSDLCAGDVSFFSCPAPRVVSRQTIDCNSPDFNVNCSTCPSSCVRCTEVIWGGAFQCRNPGASCNVRDPYEIDCTTDFGEVDLTLKLDWQLDASASCPVSGWAVPIPLIQQDLTGNTPSACVANLKAYIIGVLNSIGIYVKANHLHIHRIGPKVGKRQQVSAAQFYFEDPSDGYSSAAVANAYLSAFATGTAQVPPAMTGAPYLVAGSISTSTTTTTGNAVVGGSDIGLSKGALAGIIIGSIIGGMLIIALIAYLIIRSRRAFPQPFHAPAAAYRP